MAPFLILTIMCFTVTNPEVLVAKKDIPCFKYLNRSYTSKGHSSVIFRAPCASFRYRIGKTYSKNNIADLGTRFFTRHDSLTHEGFHSYITPRRLKYKVPHTENDAKTFQRIAVECIIPKGSLYLVNGKQKEYISSAIRVDRILILERYNEIIKKIKNGKRKTKARLAKV